MAKVIFKDYSDNYNKIKIETKRTKRIKSNEMAMQEYLELKQSLETLKNSVNTTSLSKEEVRKFVSNKKDKIDTLYKNLLEENKNVYILADNTDSIKSILRSFSIFVIFALAILVLNFLNNPSIIRVLICLGLLWGGDEFIGLFDKQGCSFRRGIKIMIGSLSFSNRYSFIKILKKLEDLKKEYNKFGKQYADYVDYINSSEISKIGETIINDKEVKDLYLLEINKLVDKVKELPLGSDRDKYLETIEKLTELYKREKERIILKNGRVHSEEEIELEMSILKQIAYIEMQIDSSLYKNKNTQLLSEDYLTTLGKLDSTKDKKLKRTLGLGK